ncbi:hypothetical protein ACSQ67_011874 [Phaseolus vulgaris]
MTSTTSGKGSKQSRFRSLEWFRGGKDWNKRDCRDSGFLRGGASSKESKSAYDKARSNGGVGESRRTLSGNERAGASFQAPPREPSQEVGVQEINDGGPASLKVCPPVIRCVENGVLSVKGVVGDLKCQSAFMKPCKENLNVRDGCHEEEEGEAGSVSRRTSSVSRVAILVGICPSVNDLERSRTGAIRDGVDGSSVATVKGIPKSPVAQGLNDEWTGSSRKAGRCRGGKEVGDVKVER